MNKVSGPYNQPESNFPRNHQMDLTFGDDLEVCSVPDPNPLGLQPPPEGLHTTGVGRGADLDPEGRP